MTEITDRMIKAGMDAQVKAQETSFNRAVAIRAIYEAMEAARTAPLEPGYYWALVYESQTEPCMIRYVDAKVWYAISDEVAYLYDPDKPPHRIVSDRLTPPPVTP